MSGTKGLAGLSATTIVLGWVVCLLAAIGVTSSALSTLESRVRVHEPERARQQLRFAAAGQRIDSALSARTALGVPDSGIAEPWAIIRGGTASLRLNSKIAARMAADTLKQPLDSSRATTSPNVAEGALISFAVLAYMVVVAALALAPAVVTGYWLGARSVLRETAPRHGTSGTGEGL